MTGRFVLVVVFVAALALLAEDQVPSSARDALASFAFRSK